MTPTLRLACSGFARSLRFYTDVLGFSTQRYDPENRRAELEREGVAIEIAEYDGDGLAALEYPFGRGATIVVWTEDVDAAYAAVEAYGARLCKPMAMHWHDHGGVRTGHAAFEVADPDGYRLRFCQSLPSR